MHTQTFRIEATSAEQLAARAPNISMLPGSTGRLEIRATRVLGICPLPLGALMTFPWVGNIWANSLTPTGAVMTGRGSIGICDAFVEWAIPDIQTQQSQVTMGIGPVLLLLVIGGIAVALSLLAWSIERLVLAVTAFVEDAPPGVVQGLVLIGAVGAGLLLWATVKKKR